MNRLRYFIRLGLLPVFLGFFSTVSVGQGTAISLEEAIQMARTHYAGLERDRLSVEQRSRMAEAGMPMQPTQLFFSGEEFNFDGQTGVQSLNVQQNFYLPKAANAQKRYYQQGALAAEKQLALTEQELKRQVEQAFYRLQYARQQRSLAAENVELYQGFLDVTTTQLELGESGKLPQLAARTRLGQAQLAAQQAEQQYQVALALFNRWLGEDRLYEAEGELPLAPRPSVDTSLRQNPHLQIMQAKQELAETNVDMQKTKLLPQINTGLRLQDAFGTFPLFGYQLGINVPLFQKAYKGRIEAAEVSVKVQEAALATERQQLERRVSELQYRIDAQHDMLEYLEEALRPIVEEQSAVNLEAYREGEVGYLGYLDSLEQVLKVKQQYLDAIFQFNVLRAELDYWLGN